MRSEDPANEDTGNAQIQDAAAQRVASAQARLNELQDAYAQLEEEKLALWSQCAEVRAESLMRGALSGPLTRSDRRMRHKLAQRHTRRAELEKQMADYERNSGSRAELAPELRQRAEATWGRWEAARAEFMEKLARDPDYQRLVERRSQCHDALSGLHSRLKHAIDERDRKSDAYTRDPLFRFLRKRGYATSGYHRSGLAYRMDRWVAAVSNHEQAQRDYELLQDMPRWLQEVIDDTATQAAKADAELDRYGEQQPGNEHLRRLEAEASEARAAYDQHTQSTAAAEAAQQARRDELQAIEKGADADTQAIRDAYRELFSGQPIPALMKLAEQTATGLDQAALRRIEQITNRQAYFDDLIAQLEEELGLREPEDEWE